MSEAINVAKIFGEDVFNDTVMQERLPKKVYKDLKKTIEEGKELADKGLKVIDWASNDNGDPDIVIAAAGTEPNLESLAAISILRKEKPELKIRFVNVVDLLKLRSPEIDPRGLSDEELMQRFEDAMYGHTGGQYDLSFGLDY